MNILRVISSMNPSLGGPSQGIRNSIPELEKLGAYNEIVSLDDADAPFIGKDNLKINAIGAAKGLWHYNENLVPWLTNNLHRFDAVIVHGLWLYQTFAVEKVVRQLRKNSNNKVPHIYIMPHGMLDPYFQRAPDRKLKALRNWLYWKLIERKAINAADGILFTCQTELLLARETFSAYRPKQELDVSYGIKAPPAYNEGMKVAFNEHCAGLNNKPYLLFLSRVHEKKGVDLLINAYKVLFNKHKDMPKLVIAGPGLDTPFGKKLIELAAEDELIKDSIFFTGMITHDAKWGAYYGCDAFVLPSHQENFGIAVAEALACSKPVLISNQVNIWREIKDGGIVDDDTLEGTKRMLEKWLQLNEGQKKQMSAMAWQVYKENFESQPAAKKFLDAISVKQK